MRIAGNVLAGLSLNVMADSGTAPGGYIFEPTHLASMPSIHVAAVALIGCWWGAGWFLERSGTDRR